MALSNYSELKTAITDHLDRDDLSSHVDDFIDLAEARHKRDIRIREMVIREAITVDSLQISLPTGMLECQSLRLLTSPISMLTYVSDNELMRFRRDGTGKPLYFTLHNEIEFDVNPDSSYNGEIVYYQAQTALSDDNTTNDLLTRAPDAYLYGALLASAPFLMHDERVSIWAGLYRESVEGLSNARRQERQTGPMVARVKGGTP